MTEFIIKHFIPNADNVNDAFVRERYGVVSGTVGIFCNILLFLVKLSIGLITASISIAADAVNNLSDALSSVISLLGFKLANKAPDETHPFGYGRTEYLAGLLVAFFIGVVGLEFAKSSIDRIINPEPVLFSPVLLLILAISILVKLWLGVFNKQLGTRINSTVLLATMQDSLNDVITTSVVVAGMIASRFTSLPVDGYIGIIVALFILYSGIGIAKDTLSPLIGQAADPNIAKNISNIVLNFDGVVGVHDLIIHNYGAGKSLASIHAEVPDTANFVQIHEVIDDAEKEVYKQTGVFLVIHMDPVAIDNEHVNELKNLTLSVLSDIDNRLTMHDFRIVDGERKINIIFDVVAPFDYQKASAEELIKNIRSALKKHDKRYNAIITLDHQM